MIIIIVIHISHFRLCSCIIMTLSYKHYFNVYLFAAHVLALLAVAAFQHAFSIRAIPSIECE